MTTLPLHPVMVHLPLALALLMPAFAAAAAWAIWTGRASRGAWLALAALQLLLVLTSVVAMKTGEREEETVEALVPGAALHLHEEYAEQFVWAGAAVLVLTLGGLLPRRARAAASLTVAGTLVVAAMAVRVGHAGGTLVYVHNAGAAYRPASATGTAGATSAGVGQDSPAPDVARASRESHDESEDR